MSIKVSVVAPSPTAVQVMARDMAVTNVQADVQSQVGSINAVCMEVLQGRPDLMVAELPAIGVDDLQMLGGALNSQPGTSVILLTADRSQATLLSAMRAGIREVVHTPLANGEFKAAYGRQIERLLSQREGAQSEGQVIAFMPVKGGSGATFLATNFAFALSRGKKRVAVIDLNLHLGDAAIFISDQPITSTMADLAQQEHRLDAALLETTMLKCASHLWLLAAPETLDAAVGIRAETVARIIALAATRFDFVVLDLGRVPDAVTLRALDMAQRLYLVAQSTLPFLHDGKRLLNLLRELGYPQEKIELVINRIEKGGDLSAADIRRALQFNSAREIPNSYANVAYAINHGLPLLQHAPRDPVAKALVSWSDEWLPPEQEAARSSGWFRSFTRPGA
jgi:pilus assembly protein CpaE